MLLLLLLLFLIPVAVYCLILASINRRVHPVIVGGAWDAIGLLFAASGFFLAVLPGIVTFVYAKTLRELPFAEKASGLEAFGNLMLEWWGILLLYYIALAVGATALVLHRRSKTVIYNINVSDWERVFAEVLAKLDLEQIRAGKQLTLGSGGASAAPAAAPETAIQAGFHQRLFFERTAMLQVDAFPALSNITLHWQQAPTDLREEIETELAKSVKQVETMENAAAAWFLGVGGTILAMVFLTVVVLVVLAFPRRF